MNIALIIVLIIVGIIALVLLIAAFRSNESTITRSITINKPAADIYNFIKLLKNSAQYNKWVMADPNMKRDYRGTDGMVGFVYAWDSQNKQVGKGEQEIIKLDEGKRVDYEIRFEKPMPGIAKAHISLTGSGNQTHVTWQFNSRLNLMMKVMHMFINFDKLLGKDLHESLQNLKNILEK